VFFDVGDDEVVAGEVIDAWWAFGVVHGVGHIAHEGDGFAEIDLLADGEGAAEDAHVEVNAAEDDVVDVAGGEEVPCFLAVIGEGVAGFEFDERVLAFPWWDDFAFMVGAGAAHVAVVDGEDGFMAWVGPAPCGAPARGGGEGDGGFGERCGFSEETLRCVLVEVGDGTGGVDDEDAFGAGGDEHFVERAGEFGDASCGAAAPVVVPHVADDDGGLGGIPDGFGFGDGAGGRGVFGPGAEREREGTGEGGGGHGEQEEKRAHG